MTAETPADRHRRVAATFTDRVRGTADWDVPTPVPAWTARDVVGHLTTWFPAFLVGSGVPVPAGPSADDDPVAAWDHQVAAVQALLDDPETAGREIANPHLGAMTVAAATDRIYTTDVLMHTWDLARATGQDDRLDPDECAALVAGMEPMEEVIRGSGQYGPRVPVPDDADAQARLLGFIGRDPAWKP
ncbi:TIGR03086 family metal-binding protein [Actinomycetospora lemnae]|uniref:TIGR03086 family metal-binding protein n=1 Tax=Actinomycetospora lemnae TaxID=3019891 RepID=A0ABT5SQH8_9PSEU|nr:TIGR03086 family metal-binding protein [Actinomycetospora sp. DW7H6]MDD7964730.1 TIGR03086 family metal-binding protein [Actinomycetospora sp. DW7H6]